MYTQNEVWKSTQVELLSLACHDKLKQLEKKHSTQPRHSCGENESLDISSNGAAYTFFLLNILLPQLG